MATQAMRPDTEQSYQQRINRVLVHIQSHLDDELPLDTLAAVASFSPFHFHRIFRGMVGESVKEHVRRLRLERAAQRLKQTDTPVTDIAFEAGYDTHESFTRAFRDRFDASPSEYRAAKSHNAGAGEVRASGRPPGPPQDHLDVRIERLGPLRLAFVRRVGPYNQVGAAWAKLMTWAGPRGLFGPGSRPIGICHDDPEITPPERLRYDAAMQVPATVQPEGEIGIQDLPLPEYAATTHRGPYDQLHLTYARLCGEWLPSSGRELASAPGIEIYLNHPQFTSPADLLTVIHLPLEP